jgi:hypothetical protein
MTGRTSTLLLLTSTKSFFSRLRRSVTRGLKFVLWEANYQPIEILINEADPTAQDRLTQLWRDSKISELQTVGLTVSAIYSTSVLRPSNTRPTVSQSALVSSVITSAFSWFNAPLCPWATKSVWYSGLTLAMCSISLATQQSIALHRIGGHSEALQRIRSILSIRDGSMQPKPRRSQLYIWQVPIMLLNISILLFLVGLAILVWNAALGVKSVVWTDEAKAGNLKESHEERLIYW